MSIHAEVPVQVQVLLAELRTHGPKLRAKRMTYAFIDLGSGHASSGETLGGRIYLTLVDTAGAGAHAKNRLSRLTAIFQDR